MVKRRPLQRAEPENDMTLGIRMVPFNTLDVRTQHISSALFRDGLSTTWNALPARSTRVTDAPDRSEKGLVIRLFGRVRI